MAPRSIWHVAVAPWHAAAAPWHAAAAPWHAAAASTHLEPSKSFRDLAESPHLHTQPLAGMATLTAIDGWRLVAKAAASRDLLSAARLVHGSLPPGAAAGSAARPLELASEESQRQRIAQPAGDELAGEQPVAEC